MNLIFVSVIFALIVVSAYGNTKHVEIKSYHLMTSTRVNWFEAFGQCRQKDMNLVSISSKQENDQILQLIASEGHSDKRFWTSGTKQGNNGIYFWMGTGKSLEFTDWSPHQPDGYNAYTNEPEACIEILENAWDQKWNDASCTAANYHFICEKVTSDNCPCEPQGTDHLIFI